MEKEQLVYRQTPVANGTLVKVIKAAMTSRAENEKLWNYYVTKAKDAIEEIAASGTDIAEVADAPAIIVPAYEAKEVAPTPTELEGSAAISNMQVLMEEIGLKGQWITILGNSEQQSKVAEAMNISSEFVPMGVLTLGYPQEDEEELKLKKQRMDRGYRKKIHFVDTLGRY